MIASDPGQRPPYIYGEILSRSMYEAARHETPGVGTFLSQGAVTGAFFGFLWPVLGMLWHPENGYNFLLIAWLPAFLAVGIGFGLFEGIALWACTYIAGHRLNVLVRAVLGILVLAILLVVFDHFFGDPPSNQTASLGDWLRVIAFYSAIGAVFGFVSGSRFKPLPALLAGSTSRWLRVPAAITGFVLRVVVIYSLMDATLILIWFLQRDYNRQRFAFVVVALVHLMAALVILFVRLPFWLLLPFALIINLPVVACVTDVLTQEQVVERYFIIAYLGLWAAFLFCRVSVSHAVFSFLNKEIHYYLID